MSLRTTTLSLLIFISFADYQSFGQSVVKNYFSINTGFSAPIGEYASTENTNVVGLLVAFGTPLNDNSGASLLIPATSSQSFSAEGAYYINKFFGVAAYGSYVEMVPDGSGVKNTLDQLVKQGSGALITQFTQGQSEQTQQFLQNATISYKGTLSNWKIATFLIGPTVSHNSGKFTFDFKVLAGLMSVNTPEVKADIDLNALFINGTLLRFQQNTVSKSVFAYQVGYMVRYSVLDYLSVKVYADYTASLNNSYDLTVTTESPLATQIQFLQSASGQEPTNFILPQPQKTTVNFPISNLNVGIGICYEFGSFAKKKKGVDEEDLELKKQQ